ncbi:hypothetical protein [Spiroplasma endosymbiont of Diplazon laetatorius]|uniref:hypothetical protein n=1 Tax=Spiroplasma endosymbiont of Diplazon laetatorius TaxID=3066322 RepID=UPI0030CDD33E
MAYKLLKKEHYLWLLNISKYHDYNEIHQALKIIREKKNIIDSKEKWVNNTTLNRNRYWILSTLVEKYNYNDVLNALNQIFSK